MNVTQVAVCPSEASTRAGRPALTPELLAASGARYSRNNEGLQSILSRIDPDNLEKSVDSIFRMVDYGHQSIADMVPVAMFIDGISIWLAYYLWTLCPLAGGQESSTRYLKMSVDGLIPPQDLGIPSEQAGEWQDLMARCFASYQAVVSAWEDPRGARSRRDGDPRSLIEDRSIAAEKKVARMRRNYAFDRARYFLPVATRTNVMLLMSARAWVNLCQYLLSHALPEARQLGELVRSELALCAPRLIRHARWSEPHERILEAEFAELVRRAGSQAPFDSGSAEGLAQPAVPSLALMPPPEVSADQIAEDLAWHPNRYAPVGSGLRRMGVRFGWSAVGFAEFRDLNRHRTGTSMPAGAGRFLLRAGSGRR